MKVKKGQKLVGSHPSLMAAIRSAKRKKRKGEIIILHGTKVHLMPRKALKKKAIKYL